MKCAPILRFLSGSAFAEHDGWVAGAAGDEVK